MASTGQTSAQAAHAVQISSSTFAGILFLLTSAFTARIEYCKTADECQQRRKKATSSRNMKIPEQLRIAKETQSLMLSERQNNQGT
jgi:hypothetical protein